MFLYTDRVCDSLAVASDMSDIVEAWATQEKEANEKAINHKILISSVSFMVHPIGNSNSFFSWI